MKSWMEIAGSDHRRAPRRDAADDIAPQRFPAVALPPAWPEFLRKPGCGASIDVMADARP
jgi:hypothetical protein